MRTTSGTRLAATTGWTLALLLAGTWVATGCAGEVPSTASDLDEAGSTDSGLGGHVDASGPDPDSDSGTLPVLDKGTTPSPDKGGTPSPDKGVTPAPDKGSTPGGPVLPPVKDPYPSEADSLYKCGASTIQWWKGASSRDITFVAFGDPHESDPSPGCTVNKNYAANQGALMRAAINSVNASPHVWPAGPGFHKQGMVYDHIRGVLIAGDLTQTGSDAAPVGTQLAHDCKEYTAYRAAYGRCGTEGKLKFPVYESYGNHDFPIVVSGGDASYHPVIDYLDKITAAYRPGSSKDLYDDPKAGTGHFAWRWDNIWFVNLNLKPGYKNEIISKSAGTRIASPHSARQFLISFLSTRGNSQKRQIVILSHYGLQSSRIEAAEKTSFCKVIDDARNATGPFTGQKLSKTFPVAAQIHGHSHNAPLYKSWTCPGPYGGIVIPRFDVGTPLYKSATNGGKLHFTIIRLGGSKLEAVGVAAPASNPTGSWTYTHKTRLEILNPV